ncbi:related to vesicular transport-associated repeat protein Tb-291 [Phialocephala subalpina]|uniref:Related to vesicular transport-associated repeat protein Tb-291 n=1 Tax=Phialocephala subalpina TaxID=576137 RepID=A0A1L7XBC5_9HELO|nr:related to vesicular transport-associated repeat protein Tb-291 [Phialocephala subalpina]
MATVRGNPRLQVGSASWIVEERATALQFAGEETEEFTFSARNDLDWLNEHMAEIFSKNQVNVADIFKTPGKLRGKTPRTARKGNLLELRAPLTDIFSAPIQGGGSPFRQTHFERPVATFKVAEDESEQMEVDVGPSSPTVQHTSPPKPPHNFVDSGYHGSQPEGATQATQPTQPNDSAVYQRTPQVSPRKAVTMMSPNTPESEESDENVVILGRDSDARRATDESFRSAKEEQTRNVVVEPVQEEAEEMDIDEENDENKEPDQVSYPVLISPLQERHQQPESPAKRSSPRRPSPAKESPVRTSPAKSSPMKASPPKLSPAKQQGPAVEDAAPEGEDEPMEDVQSPSEGSPSPIRPIVRKSSLNFASLPAREPLTTKKSIGNRVSRTSQLEQSRTSYYGRQTGGKSLGNTRPDEENDDEMDLDQADEAAAEDDTDTKMKRLHNKTSTQRLQDQISMLGQSQSNMRPSKSIPGNAIQPQPTQPIQPPATQDAQRTKSPVRTKSPTRKSRPPPGAFPEDEEDSWIGPPPAAIVAEPSIFSPRPQMAKSHSTDVMEGIHGKDSIGGAQFNIPKRGSPVRHLSPVREPTIPEQTTSTLGHGKSVSTSVLKSPKKDSPIHRKPIAVSNPTPSIASNDPDASTTPPKSPARSHRGSPLKAAKDKFSSILKTSRGLFASSAAVSAEAKSSAISPMLSRADLRNAAFEDAVSEANNKSPTSSHAPSNKSQMSLRLPESPFKHSARKTRASTEREEKKKEDEARAAKEAKEQKEAQKMANQLEKARMKVREEARVFHEEQERVAAMQKEVEARKAQEKQTKASQVDIPRATRTSPRKTKAQLEAEGIAAAAASTTELANADVDMSEAAQASQAMPPPSIPRPKSQIGRPGPKRPLKPAKAAASKVNPPTVIRVDTGSQRGHHQHPSTTALSASLQDSLASSSSQQSAPSQGLRHKASTSSIQSKASTSSFKSAASKALEAAARKKEQDELAAQKKREAKAEIERQRAAIKEEERRKEEQQRKQELERQRELQRERERAAAAADAKKAASRQAIEKRRLEMEKAKETKAPPPAARPQPNAEFGSSMLQDKALPPVPRGELAQSKPSRMNPTAQRQQEDMRPTNSVMHNSAKLPAKRPLPQDEDNRSRPTLQRNGPSYHQQEHQAKRRRTSDDFDDDEDITEDHPKMTAPPIRQSSSRQNMPTKSLFPSGYANAPPPNSLQRSTLINQHNMNQSKPTHPMDMTQVSKAPIPFASSSKTPARPGAPHGAGKSAAKSAAKSSPHYQNGETIVLPEIHTDSEEEDDDKDEFVAADWTNSPDLRRKLFEQENMDPATIFGNPGPLNMEEVFSKSKDRFHKFRARTSSANWSGQDRLTEDEIKKDLRARDQVRRQGGWTYDSMV